jgi:creatinine deaminase
MMDRPLAVGMARAIEEARSSRAEGGIPIGASLVAAHGAILAGGHNRRVQSSSPTLHAEIDCLERAGRQRSYAGMTLYTTLMPCYMCAGAIVQFEIPEVVVGEARTFPGARDWLQQRGVRVLDLDSDECYDLLQGFIAEKTEIWLEDIGAPDVDASSGPFLDA